MSFQDDIQSLVGLPISASKYIYGSIFHLLFASPDGEAKLICNGCQWALVDESDAVVLQDEAPLSSGVIGSQFTGKRLRATQVSADELTLRFDDIIFHAFMTQEYHLDIHEGVALGSPEWRQMPEAARHSFVIIKPLRKTVGWEFSAYSNIAAAPWGAAYLAMQETPHGG